MRQTNKMKEDEFKQRYSDIGAIRTWLYLQLGVHYGKIPYVTEPLSQVSDLHDQSKFPLLDLDPLIDSLVRFAESLPYTNDYPTGTTLQTVVDGYSTQKFFINKNMLLGDLYLWDGQYNKAAIAFRRVLDINGTAGNNELFLISIKYQALMKPVLTMEGHWTFLLWFIHQDGVIYSKGDRITHLPGSGFGFCHLTETLNHKIPLLIFFSQWWKLSCKTITTGDGLLEQPDTDLYFYSWYHYCRCSLQG